jgi:hypothetical protein
MLTVAICSQPLFAIDKNSLDAAITAQMPQVIAWRRDFHQHPELSNREFRTSTVVANTLKKLDLEVKTGWRCCLHSFELRWWSEALPAFSLSC